MKEGLTTLLMITSILSDAKNKQTTNETVKEWLNESENLAYDLDDLVDELNTEALQRRLVGTESRNSKYVTSLVVESDVHGREEDRGKISEMLGAESSESPVSVILVVGIGGVGKTTLVQLVYKDERVNEEFDLKA
ncbi:disease resistance RPP13 1 [Olea europaea subsp. europaea]|uniref:Disease resistance RPP13 1 n=1 Tax=Olea europaea subsp. europaea TaxID=158383 RepID=A0A8S0QVC1_OLEEU|nr:disease resistance RPP13 1 [Olea europaea subsp. europaea]